MTDAQAVCHSILPGVSRTFALLIPELDDALRDAVCCAYLICRLADTVEDVPDIELDLRRVAFDALANAVRQTDPAAALVRFADVVDDWPVDDAHRRLLTEAPTVFEAFSALPRADRRIISDCALEMIGGMRAGIEQRGASDAALLRDVRDLDRYCYYVAGVVGRMLTRLFWRTVYGDASGPPAALVQQGIDFGLGLQLTNVLKDHRADLQRGVSFMPAALAASLHVTQDDVLHGALPGPMRAWLVAHAAKWLDTAFEYVLVWPASVRGIRVFCLGALLMAVRTLAVVLASCGDLTADENPKITRQDVAEIMDHARQDAGDDERLRDWYATDRRRLDALLPSGPSPTTSPS